MHYLLKTEPTAYSFAELVREKETDWTGVTNPQAVKTLAAMKKGDKLVIYHTGDEKAAVGVAHVKSVDLSDPKVPLVQIAAGPAIKRPKTLAEIRQQPIFQTSPLVRQARLSVVPLEEAQYDWIVHN
jgi:predicted RNA-binding protein with PUA-like domain